MAAFIYHQRIYDTGLAAWVYYSKTVIDPAPLAGETTPNHTGALVAASHEVVSAQLDLSSGAQGSVLWRWDGVSTAIFDVANAVIFGSVTGVVASVAQREQGPVLRLTASRSGAGNGIFSVPLALGFPLPERYLIKMRMREVDSVAAPDWAGVEFFSNGLAGASRFGACAMSDKNGAIGTAGVAPIIEAGAFGADWNTFNSGGWDDATTSSFGALFEYHVAVNRAAAKPEGSIIHTVKSVANATTQEPFVQGDFPSGAWVPGDLTTIGLCARDVSAAADVDMAVEFSDIVIEAVDLS